VTLPKLTVAKQDQATTAVSRRRQAIAATPKKLINTTNLLQRQSLRTDVNLTNASHDGMPQTG
jgi:hypothetical protein